MHALPEKLEPLAVQPEEKIEGALGFCTRTITLERAGSYIPQHAHQDNHATLVCNGAARAWVDGVWIGDFEPGDLIPVEAGKEHVFQSLVDQTRLACIFFEKET